MEVGKIRRRTMSMFFVVWVIVFTGAGQTIPIEAADGPYASNPIPADGELIDGIIYMDNIYTTLEFTPGDSAVSHEAFFSDDQVKVATRDPNVSLGPPPFQHDPEFATTYYVGFPLVAPYTDSLVRGVTYYWCVDETDDMDNTYPGDIWEFTVRDYKASFPDPPDEDTFVETDVLLSWIPGYDAYEHDVYLGTSWEDVNNAVYNPSNPPPEFLDTISEPNMFVTGLDFNNRYYWRVDEVQPYVPPMPRKVYKGDVWSFTTILAEIGTIRMDLWWNVIHPWPPWPIIPLPNPDPGPDETRFLTSFDSGEYLGENYKGQIHGWLHPKNSGDYTFWLANDEAGELFLSTDDQPANLKRIAYVNYWTAPYEWYDPGELYQQSVPIPLVAGRKYYIMARWQEGSGGDHCMVAWQGPDQPLPPVSGEPDAVIPGNRLSPFAQKCAYDPDPCDGQTDVALPVTLRWSAGDYAAKHDVYIGTDKALVEGRDYSTYMGRVEFNRYGPIELQADQIYYWAIDEVNELGPAPYVWRGDVWCFTTAISVGRTYHVDCINGDNTNDGLTPETAFKTIQRGINVADDYDTVLVWPGVYNEEISFWGDAITVKSAADAAIVETDYGYAFSFFSAEESDTVLSNFVIRNSQYGIYLVNGSNPTLKNLTIVNNDFGISAFNGADPDISSCILWNNYYGDLFREPVPLQARYSCIEEGGEGEGNISVEPLFADANIGDYHLLSERGRYWPAHDVWVLDDVTSPCIDGGDPTIDPSNERMPNGGRINMGAYGNTAYASMSECWSKADFNCDGVVNFIDFAIMAASWLDKAAWIE